MSGQSAASAEKVRVATLLSLPLAYPSGVSTFVAGLLDALGERCDLDLRLIQPDRFEAGPGERLSQVRLAGRQLLQLLRARPDVVHNHEHPVLLTAAVAYRALARKPVRVVHTVHVDPVVRRSLWKRLAFGWLLARCWAVTAVSGHTASQLANVATPVPRQPRVIYGATDIKVRQRDDPAAAQFRAALGVYGDPVICQVGPLNTPKKVAGVLCLIEAFALVRARLPTARLLLVGDGTLRATVDAARARAGVSDAVIVTGYVQDVSRALALADVYCQISLQDACPLGLLEAMASGKAVVASRSGGIPEIIADGVDGRLVDTTPAEVADALVHLCAYPDEARALGKQALATARARFTWARAAEEFANVYVPSDSPPTNRPVSAQGDA